MEMKYHLKSPPKSQVDFPNNLFQGSCLALHKCYVGTRLFNKLQAQPGKVHKCDTSSSDIGLVARELKLNVDLNTFMFTTFLVGL